MQPVEQFQQQEPPVSVPTTLDEPVHLTLWRDLKRIGIKLFHVIIPRGQQEKHLKDWDLWGPFLFCLIFSIIMNDIAPVIFVLLTLGSCVITVNSILLGGKITFFQSVCVVGYCVFPLLLGAIVIGILTEFYNNTLLRIGISMGCFAWSTFASVGFLAGLVPADRKLLAVYPVLLFYLVLAWLLIAHFG